MITNSKLKSAAKSLKKVYEQNGIEMPYTQSMDSLSTMFGYDTHVDFKKDIKQGVINKILSLGEKNKDKITFVNDVISFGDIIAFPVGDDYECLKMKITDAGPALYLLDDNNSSDMFEITREYVAKHHKHLKDILMETKLLKYIPEQKMNYQMIIDFVSYDGENLQYVPEKFISIEVVKLAIKQNGMALKYVPDEFRNIDICVLALQNGGSLKYVPDMTPDGVPLKTYELCKLAIDIYAKNAQKYISEFQKISRILPPLPNEIINADLISPLNFIPENIMIDKEFCKYALEQFNFGDALIAYNQYHKDMDVEAYENFVKNNPYYIRYVPLKTYNMIKYAICINGDFARWINHDMLTPELCFEAIKNSYSSYGKRLYNDNTKLLAEKYNMDELTTAFLSKDWFVLKDDYNTRKNRNMKNVIRYTYTNRKVPQWLIDADYDIEKLTDEQFELFDTAYNDYRNAFGIYCFLCCYSHIISRFSNIDEIINGILTNHYSDGKLKYLIKTYFKKPVDQND